ncbi:drug/metabolite transporter (DMT)-like permease [Virgibacillus halotolerans]|uniref:EamA family transporter n=1 Tax=Virgibacillus halotolerans TaxID=1071053 RepID=UPI0019619C95|nr:DMT family transporter [Virgibacillus halotolerans]MBM7600805.1 drug/metabolite transporter (DMT)-like permease [Virgibacillus halotolerans]
MQKNKGIIYVLIGATSFGFTPIFAKLSFSLGYSLGQLNIIQMLISFLILWGITLLRRSNFKELTTKNMAQIMLTGSFVGLTTIFYYGSIQFLPASLAIILLFQFVWIGIIYDWIFTKTKPTIITLLATVFILIGVLFASNIFNGATQELPTIGFIYGILSAFTYAGFIFFSGKVATSVDPWVRSSFMVSGSVILVLVLFMKDIPTIPVTDGGLWLVATGVALFGAVLPPLFFAQGAPLITSGLSNILSAIELPVAIVSASILLSESVTLLQWMGTILIIFAIILNEIGNVRLQAHRAQIKKHT